MVTSPPVAAMAGKMLRSGLSPLALSKRVTVTVPPEPGVLDISCAASSAGGAASCANAFAKAYLQNHGNTAAASLNAQVKVLQGKVNGLNKALSQASGGYMITAASPPGLPASPDKTLVLPGGLAAGLLLGLIVEFWLDRRDKQSRPVVVR